MTMAKSMAAPRRARGVTLLEMIVVMLLISAATVLGAMAATGGFDRLRLQSASKQIAANLRYARAQALATGEQQQFTINPGKRTWRGVEDRAGEIPDSLEVRFIGAREVQPSREEGAIVFFADGASTGGRVHQFTKHAAWDIDVAWLTGEVRVRRAKASP